MRASGGKGNIFVFTGPDGSGRKTIADMAGTTLGLRKVLSYTTRKRRAVEHEGQDYYFIGVESFREAEARGEFVESVSIDGHHYGIKHKDIERLWSENGFVYVILNPEGAAALRAVYGENVVRLFLYADRSALLDRQRLRGDDEDVISRHMSHYDEAMAYMADCEYAFENIDIAHTVYSITNTLERYMNRQLLNLD